MSERVVTSKVVNEVIRYGSLILATGAVLTLPGLGLALEKPLQKLLGHLDERDRQRELRRIVYKMREQGLLVGEYQHGLQLTEKSIRRLKRSDTTPICYPPDTWDGKWRIVMYDIPNNQRDARLSLKNKLRHWGCVSLQKSVFITPFACQDDIETISVELDVHRYVTVFTAEELSNSSVMLDIFKKKYPLTLFPKPTPRR